MIALLHGGWPSSPNVLHYYPLRPSFPPRPPPRAGSQHLSVSGGASHRVDQRCMSPSLLAQAWAPSDSTLTLAGILGWRVRLRPASARVHLRAATRGSRTLPAREQTANRRLNVVLNWGGIGFRRCDDLLAAGPSSPCHPGRTTTLGPPRRRAARAWTAHFVVRRGQLHRRARRPRRPFPRRTRQPSPRLADDFWCVRCLDGDPLLRCCGGADRPLPSSLPALSDAPAPVIADDGRPFPLCIPRARSSACVSGSVRLAAAGAGSLPPGGSSRILVVFDAKCRWGDRSPGMRWTPSSVVPAVAMNHSPWLHVASSMLCSCRPASAVK